MSPPFGLISVVPFPPRGPGFPNRPRALLDELRNADEVASVTIIGRLRPGQHLRGRGGRLDRSGARTVSVAAGVEIIEHPWPFGPLEAALIRRIVRRRMSQDRCPWVLWISDPKSAGAFSRLRDIPTHRLVRVFDAYDAWDLSPLVRGRRRHRAVLAGYASAAQFADVILANTEFMADRFRAMGAAATVVPNASPRVIEPPLAPGKDGPAPYLVYVGRIHERVQASLIRAVADAFPAVPIRIVGPVERAPAGWTELTQHANVRLHGPMVGNALIEVLRGAAALLLPHRVDDYTRSQDAMKAWEAIAVGIPVVATALPPVIGWPPGLAAIGADEAAFVAAVRTVLDGALNSHRAERLAYAAANGWDARARTAIQMIQQARDR